MASIGRASLLVLGSTSLLVSAGAGCSSQDNTARMVGGSSHSGASSSGASSGGGGGSGNTTTSGSSSGGASGSSSTSGGSGGSAVAPGCMILPVNNALISEFTPPEAQGAGGAGGDSGAAEPPSKVSFGYDADPPTVASGFSFFYPEGTLTSDMSEGDWHISGSVAEYAGFQIAFVCGADAKAYKGISFKVSGSAGPTGALSFVVAHASDSWRNPAVTDSAASCVSANQYDGTCNEATAPVEVTETATTISLLWTDIQGGKPEANPDPAELLGLRWLFKWDEAMSADAAANAYDVDVRVDDLTFIE